MTVAEGEAKKIKPAWWNYVKQIIRDYPRLKRLVETPLPPKFTSGGGTPYCSILPDGTIESCLSFEGRGGGEVSRPAERCVIHDLPEKDQRRYDAVCAAIRRTKTAHPDDWRPRMEIIERVYFQRTHTIAGAAVAVGCHENTAGYWQAEFIRLVAEELDLP